MHTSMLPELPKVKPLWLITMACVLPRYTSRLEIWQCELFSGSFAILSMTVAFVLEFIFNAPSWISTERCSCLEFPITNEHSAS